MRNLRRVQGLVLLLAFFGTLMGTGQVQAIIAPIPEHLTNLDSLFADPPYGSDSQLPVNGVTVITPNKGDQAGSIWSKPGNKIDLTRDFEATMLVNLGDSFKSDGSLNPGDGMAFVMHNDLRGTDTILNDVSKFSGQSLGVWGSVDPNKNKSPWKSAIQNSLAIEFDTHPNGDYDSGVAGTPHIAWNYPARSSAYTISGWPSKKLKLNHNNLETFSYLSNEEPTKGSAPWREFKVSWNASTKILTYTFNGKSKSIPISDPKSVFAPDLNTWDNKVYWGFTGKTGGNYELNQVAFVGTTNVPKTSQSYEIYHKKADGSQGAVVTQTNPAKPNEPLIGIVTANNSADSKIPWTDLALRYNEGSADSRGIRYTVNDGITINNQNISQNNVSTGLFKTPSLDIEGDPNKTPVRNAVDTDIFNNKDTNGYGLGVNTGDLVPGGQTVVKMQLTAMDPTETNGKINNGQKAMARLDGGTVGQVSTFMTYVTSIPTMTLNGQFLDTTAKNPAIVEKNKAFNLTGNWEQSSKTGKIDADAKGTLHYSIDDGAEQTVALDSTGGAMSAPIPTAGLTMNQPHKITAYMTNAGYNEKSNIKTAYFQIKGGELKFAKVNPTVAFNSVQVGKTVTAQRATTDWAPTVADSRGRDSQWTLSASTTGLTRTTDGKKLAGRMMYVDGQKQTPLTSTPIVITSKTTTTDNEELTAVNWAADQGILLNVNADAYVGDYTGTVDWTLASVPEP